MRASTLVSLRANAVLVALCIAASDGGWLLACGCAGHVQAIGSMTIRVATLVSAAIIVLVVRRLAKLAFDAARAARYVALKEGQIVVGASCPRDWLVQLYVELHPFLALQSAAHACAHAVPSSRVPRGRA